MNRFAPVGLAALMFVLADAAHAGPMRLLLETNDNADAGAEVFEASFATPEDVVASNFFSAAFTDIDIAPTFDLVGLAYDGAYRLLVESKDNQDAGDEIFAATYNTYDDLLSGNFSSALFTQVDLAPTFSVGGFAYDGQYRLFLESNENRDSGEEVLAVTYDSFDAFIGGSFSAIDTTQLDLAPTFDMVGLAFDGAYRLLIETINDELAGEEIFFADFLSFEDLIGSNIDRAGFTAINAAPFVTARGYAFEQDAVAQVPEPPTALLIFGMLSLLALRKSQIA